MMKTITALEISQRLPMTVKCLNVSGMFAGRNITFVTCDADVEKDWNIKGTAGIGKSLVIYDMTAKFGVLEDETDNRN